MPNAESEPLRKTPLHDLHIELGAKMVPFAGYEMPVQYPAGILAEHRQTREMAGLFDVSHMGQVKLSGDDPAGALETLVPGEIQRLDLGRMRYTQLTNEVGGILDDLMVTNRQDHLFLVLNAACKEADVAHLRAHIGDRCNVAELEDRALLALQGPAAVDALVRLASKARGMSFMSGVDLSVDDIPCFVTRSGYTGEDGFELSVPAADGVQVARRLLAEAEVEPVGLGARDSLRLEAGLCLYGHDIDTSTTPVEAALQWSIGKRRREEGGFLGAEVVQRQLSEGVARKRVGLLPDGRAPAREHTEITDADGKPLGQVTSGGFGPSLDRPVAMGYVHIAAAEAGHQVQLIVRGTPRPATVAALPFRPSRYYRGD